LDGGLVWSFRGVLIKDGASDLRAVVFDCGVFDPALGVAHSREDFFSKVLRRGNLRTRYFSNGWKQSNRR
jgi:hypothetical protein